MLNVAVHGLGRVGRNIVRQCALGQDFNVVAVNDLNPDVDNIAYSLNHDTVYGRPPERFVAQDRGIWLGSRRIQVLNEPDITATDWSALGVDALIDASGTQGNVARLKTLVERGKVGYTFTTGLAPDADFVLTLGSNDRDLRPQHRVISCNTCDATAIAPVLSSLEEKIGLESASVAILHPWLNHQHLLDSRPPEAESRYYEMGRSAHDNIIPKRTSSEAALRHALPRLSGRSISAISYRVPTPIVACADLSVTFSRSTSREEVVSVLELYQKHKPWKLVLVNREALVSSDFTGEEHAAILEERLLNVTAGKLGRLTLWYDNEWGYAARVLDQVRLCVLGLGIRKPLVRWMRLDGGIPCEQMD